jgi:hypothetical protein
MFIADAWADFSYIGVIGFSIAVGIICRTIDIVFLARGKTVTAVAVLAAAFVGIYNLMISALPTSMLSGGLILPPLLLVVIVEGQKLLRMTTGTGSSTSASTASPRAEVDELS